MSGIEVTEIVESIEKLPTLPVIVGQIQKLINNPRSSMAQIALVISKDQAIAARVIRLINSAYYGFTSRVGSIQQAIVLLGLNAVRNLVVGVSVIKSFNNRDGNAGGAGEQLWLHTLATAMASRQIALDKRLEEPEDFFLAGLLHDIGILLMDQFAHETYAAMITETAESGSDYYNAERSWFGLAHDELGALLAKKWNMPEYLSTTMASHHTFTPSRVADAREREVVAAVAYADHLACQAGYGPGLEYRCSGSQQARDLIPLVQGGEERIVESISREISEVAREWGIL